MPTAYNRIEAKLRRSKENVFLRRDFARYASDRQVGRALRQLCDAGAIVRAGAGIYVRARASSVTGKPVPVLSLIEIGLQALSKLGVSANLGNAAKEYMAGKTTQIPIATVINTGKARITRKIGFGKQRVRYEQGN